MMLDTGLIILSIAATFLTYYLGTKPVLFSRMIHDDAYRWSVRLGTSRGPAQITGGRIQVMKDGEIWGKAVSIPEQTITQSQPLDVPLTAIKLANVSDAKGGKTVMEVAIDCEYSFKGRGKDRYENRHRYGSNN